MKKSILSFCLFFSLFSFWGCKQNTKPTDPRMDLTTFVDPMIGTGYHGHTFPGPTLPHGQIQLSPDTHIMGWDASSGYHYDDKTLYGFSHNHLSGTGIGDLGDIRLMPINKKVDLAKEIKTRDDISYKSSYSHQQENAKAGYYSVFLKDHNINAELTSSLRTAFHRYTFKENDKQSVIIDLGDAFIPFDLDKNKLTQIKIEDKFTISGFRHSTGWAKNQKVFFVAKFSKSIKGFDLVADSKYVEDKIVTGLKTAAQLYFNDLSVKQLNVKVGVSSVSVKNALENISDNNDRFTKTKDNAFKSWNKALSRIKVETAIDSLKTIFYTALYHAQLAPVTFSDANGEFRMENDRIVKETGYTTFSTLSLWDSFRAQQPLLTILEPNKVSDIINSMLRYYESHKLLPVWNLYGNETNTMTGYHSIPVIVEAYFKGIKGFDVYKAYEAMKTTMTQDERGLNHYKKYGYVPHNLLDESVTITLDYAFNDWCVAKLAKALGKQDDYTFFSDRSKSYRNVFDAKTGFMRGKFEDGKSWKEPFDPKHSAHAINAEYTEGNAWQHSWFVPHNVEDLINLHGNTQIFTERLEQLFTESSEITGDNISKDISGLIGQYAHGNEPSHHIAYLFNYANKPWRTQYWVRQILKTQYNTTSNGLSGNEDCGQMSAWYVLSSIGLYTMNPASENYEIGSPIFDKTTISISDEKSFIIEAEHVSNKNIYIQSATLNGKVFNQTFISHKQILNGGTLNFVMGSVPNKNWGITKNRKNNG